MYRIKTAFFVSLSTMLLLSCMTTKTKQAQQPQQLICIPEKFFRCEPDKKRCTTIPIIRDFGEVEIAVNITDRHVRSYSGDKTLSYSDIDSLEQTNGLIYLSGKWYGIDKAYRAWTAIIDLENGNLYSTSITTGAGHITYGKCYDKNKY